ncbi:MAG TPA: nucleotidyltransferase family protein [Nitrososphaerales archaeon]|nr:nucleotidyltransferase family protein [Nitrososphaerales archaeon]
MKAVVLAGGLGSRLRPLTYIMPKAMLPVANKPILEHIIEFLKKYDIKEVIVATGYLGRIIEDYFKDGSKWGVSISYTEARPLGTAGQLRTAEKELSETFLAMNGDILVDVNLTSMKKQHARSSAIATVAVKEYQYKLKYGILEFGSDNVVKKWFEKPTQSSWMNIGLYVMEPEILKNIPAEKTCSLEYDVFPKIIARGHKMSAFRTKTDYLDIGDLQSLDAANQDTSGNQAYDA